MKKYYVIENNGGGLALVVFAEDGETIEYIHTGYEYNQGQLTEDLEALRAGENPVTDWDGNELEETDLDNPEDLESWYPWADKGIGWEVVADNDGTYPDDMGAAAKAEFGVE